MSEVQRPGTTQGLSLDGRGDEAPDEPRLPGLVVVAPILGTVDLERALGTIRHPSAEVGAPAIDPLLGARVVLIHDAERGLVAVAEPSSEGRLAASLARHDEGLVGWYAIDPDNTSLAAVRRRAAAAGVAVSRTQLGPLGASLLILDRPATGPHLVIVERRSIPSGR